MSGQETVIQSLVDGGKASAGPPLGPALGPTGVNVYQIIQAINEKTKDYSGLKVPVTITINTENKSFEIEVGTPPTSALLMKELGVEKGSGTPPDTVGDLDLSQVIQVAKIKQDVLLANSLKAATKEVLGTAITMGVTINDKDPKEIQKEIDEGLHDSLFTD